MTKDEVIRTLTRLIDVCLDGEDSCYVAAQGVVSPELSARLNEHSQMWGAYADQLADVVSLLGGDPTLDDCPVSRIGQGWAELKTVIKAGSDAAIVQECLRLETEALQICQDALGLELPGSVRVILDRQRRRLTAAYQAVHTQCGSPIMEWTWAPAGEGHFSGENPRAVP